MPYLFILPVAILILFGWIIFKNKDSNKQNGSFTNEETQFEDNESEETKEVDF